MNPICIDVRKNREKERWGGKGEERRRGDEDMGESILLDKIKLPESSRRRLRKVPTKEQNLS